MQLGYAVWYHLRTLGTSLAHERPSERIRMKRGTLFRLSVTLAALAAASLAILPLTRNTEKVEVGSTAAAAVVRETPAPGTAAMRAYINPETGKLEVGTGPG